MHIYIIPTLYDSQFYKIITTFNEETSHVCGKRLTALQMMIFYNSFILGEDENS